MTVDKEYLKSVLKEMPNEIAEETIAKKVKEFYG